MGLLDYKPKTNNERPAQPDYYAQILAQHPDPENNFDDYVVHRGVAEDSQYAQDWGPGNLDQIKELGRKKVDEERVGGLTGFAKGMLSGTEGLAGSVNSILRMGVEANPMTGLLNWGGYTDQAKQVQKGLDYLATPFREGEEYWNRAQQTGLAALPESQQRGSVWENPSLGRITHIVGGAVPSLAAAAVAGPEVGPMLLGLSEGAPTFGEARAAGKSPLEAAGIALTQSTVNTALEYLPLEKILGHTKGFWTGALWGGLEEGAQEAVQQFSQNLISKIGYDNSRDLTDGMLESFIGGAGSGAAVGGVTGGLNRRALAPYRARALEMGLSNQEFDQLAGNLEMGVQNWVDASRDLMDRVIGDRKVLEDPQVLQARYPEIMTRYRQTRKALEDSIERAPGEETQNWLQGQAQILERNIQNLTEVYHQQASPEAVAAERVRNGEPATKVAAEMPEAAGVAFQTKVEEIAKRPLVIGDLNEASRGFTDSQRIDQLARDERNIMEPEPTRPTQELGEWSRLSDNLWLVGSKKRPVAKVFKDKKGLFRWEVRGTDAVHRSPKGFKSISTAATAAQQAYDAYVLKSQAQQPQEAVQPTPASPAIRVKPETVTPLEMSPIQDQGSPVGSVPPAATETNPLGQEAALPSTGGALELPVNTAWNHDAEWDEWYKGDPQSPEARIHQQKDGRFLLWRQGEDGLDQKLPIFDSLEEAQAAASAQVQAPVEGMPTQTNEGNVQEPEPLPDQVPGNVAAEGMLTQPVTMEEATRTNVQALPQQVQDGEAEPAQSTIPEAGMDQAENRQLTEPRTPDEAPEDYVFHRGKDPKKAQYIILAADDRASIDSYGKDEYAIPRRALIQLPDWVQDYAEQYYKEKHGEAYDEYLTPNVDPEDIVNAAEAWDDAEFVTRFWEDNEKELLDLSHKGIVGFKTAEGAVIFPGPNVPYSHQGQVKESKTETTAKQEVVEPGNKDETPEQQKAPEHSQSSQVQQFREAYDKARRGNKYLYIHKLRTDLGWDRETFDDMLDQLMVDGTVAAFPADPSKLTAEENQNSFEGRDGIHYLHLTWRKDEVGRIPETTKAPVTAPVGEPVVEPVKKSAEKKAQGPEAIDKTSQKKDNKTKEKQEKPAKAKKASKESGVQNEQISEDDRSGLAGEPAGNGGRAEPAGDVSERPQAAGSEDGRSDREAGERRGPTERGAIIRPVGRHGDAQRSSGLNYQITPEDDFESGGSATKFSRNLEAITLLKKIESENRLATSEEQSVLARYTGWGGLAQYFRMYGSESRKASELKQLLTKDEYESARASTPNAHYTSPLVIQKIYDALKRLGFQGGRILEPGMGVGHFFGLNPFAKSQMTGVELDSLSGRIAKQLYQGADIRVQGYEKSKLPDGYFDLAVGNVPFGDYVPFDRRYFKDKLFIHDYYFIKSLDKVRPGGLVAFITSTGTMDKQSERIRRKIADRAELVGAVRLPNTAFKGIANTQVTTDVLFLRKYEEGENPKQADWMEAKPFDIDGQTVSLNQYYHDHPENMLGKPALDELVAGSRAALAPTGDLAELLDQAMQRLPENVFSPKRYQEPPTKMIMAAKENIRPFEFYESQGRVWQAVDDTAVEITAEPDRFRQFIGLRSIVRQTLSDQLEGKSESKAENLKQLNQVYDRFVEQYGPLHDPKNIRAFNQDPDYGLMMALEKWDRKAKTATKTDIFRKQTVERWKPVEKAANAQDALVASLYDRGRIDLEHMAQITGLSQEALIEDLEGRMYQDPDQRDAWVPADEYLSGNVRAKLASARSLAKANPALEANVRALEAVQPQDLTPEEIRVKLGMGWIDEADITEFAKDVTGVSDDRIRFTYLEQTGNWILEGPWNTTHIPTSEFGTAKVNPLAIILDSLNMKDTIVRQKQPDGSTMVDKEETEAAQEAQKKVRERFQTWIWKNPFRSERLTQKYNQVFNSHVLRQYDGRVIGDRVPGMSIEYTLRTHQKNALWRIMQGDNVLLAHGVGAGKTMVMAAAAMELRRLGLARKPMVVVPKHLIVSWGNKFQDYFPGAKLLVASENDLTPAKRKEFMSRIATGDWDAVIVTYTNFAKLPVSQSLEKEFVEEQIAELDGTLANIGPEQKRSRTVKQLEKLRKTMEAKLAALQDRKDTGLTFEELGVDRLMVDEAHNFKNLGFATSFGNIKGISAVGNKVAAPDMFIKCRFLNRLTNQKALIFATGTPVSNTMGELYNLQRYLDWQGLQETGNTAFDAWANNFGEVVTSVEVDTTGSGYKPTQRFARFVNLPELQTMFRKFADVVHSDQAGLSLPDVQGGKPEVVSAEASPALHRYIESLLTRMEQLQGRFDPAVDNHLKIITDGKMAALDLRLRETVPDHPESKINACVGKAFDIWKNTKGTQLIFCDNSSPQKGFNLYDDVRNKLVARGIPRKQIAFIHEAKTDADKAELFDKVNNGTVRILMGSTKKMGEGMNVQTLLVAQHELDPPWKPSEVEQRRGRIVRQGNTNKEVQLYRYVTKGSFDAYMWQVLENKARFISQLISGGGVERTAEDIDGVDLSYAEAKALASGNPLILEKITLEGKLQKLVHLRRADEKRRITLTRQIGASESRIKGLEGQITALKRAEKQAKPKPEDKDFTATIALKKYGDRKKAQQALYRDLARLAKRQDGQWERIAEYRGLSADARAVSNYLLIRVGHGQEINQAAIQLEVHRPEGYANADTAAQTYMRALDRGVNGLGDGILASKDEMIREQAKIDDARRILDKPFEHQEEIDRMTGRLKEVNTSLNKDQAEHIDLWAENKEPEVKVGQKIIKLRPKAPVLQEELDEIRANWRQAPKVVVVQQLQNLPERVYRRLANKANERGWDLNKSRIKGMFLKDLNAVYLVADNLKDRNEAVMTMIHETVGHYGVRKVLGQHYDRFLSQLFMLKHGEIKKLNETYRFDLSTLEGRIKAADEWFAKAVGKGEIQDSVWQRFVRAIKDFLRSLGVDLNISDADVAGLAEKSRAYLEGRYQAQNQQTAGDIQFDVDEDKRASRAKDESVAILKGLRDKFRNIDRHGILGQIFTSQEWDKSRAGKILAEAATTGREERKHQVFNQVLNEPDASGKTPVQQLTELRNEGLSWWDRFKGVDPFGRDDHKLSKDYRAVKDALVHMDVTGITWEVYQHKFKGSDRARKAIEAYRGAMDRAMELMRANVKEVIDAYEAAGKPVPVIGTKQNSKGEEKPFTLWDAYKAMGSLVGSYMPRIREQGDFYVSSIGPDGEAYRWGAAGEISAKRLKNQLRREGHTRIDVRKQERLPEEIYQDINIEAVSKALEQAVGGMKDVDPDVQAKLRLDLIESTANLLKARAMRAHRIARRTDVTVKGYKDDPLTSFIEYSHRLAGGIAKGEAATKMFEAITGGKRDYERDGDDWVLMAPDGEELDRRRATKANQDQETAWFKYGGVDPTKQPDRYNQYVRYITEQLKNPDRFDRAINLGKALISFKYLGFNPRSALVNTTAMLTTVPPAIQEYALGGKGNFAEIGRALSKAGLDYGRVMRGKKLEGDEQKFLDEIQEKGWDAPQLTRDAMKEVRSGYGKSLDQVMGASMWLFGVTEKWNRGSTMLAAYRLARARGLDHAKAAKRAQEASNRAHGIYGRGTLPSWALGSNPAAKLFQTTYTYQKFAHNYLQMLGDLVGKRNYKALAFALVSPAIVGGTASSVGYAAITGVVGAILKAFGDDRDPEKMAADVVRDYLGEGGERAWRYGLFGIVPGVDLSGSLAVGWPEFGGPFLGVAEDMGEAWRQLSLGRPGRALESALPTVAARVPRAFREAEEGATSKRGNRIWTPEGQPYRPSAVEQGVGLLGFRPAERARTAERDWESKRELSRFADRRNRIYEQYRAYLTAQDPDEYDKIMTQVNDYNDLVKSSNRQHLVPLITGQSLKNQVRKMARPSRRDLARLE